MTLFDSDDTLFRNFPWDEVGRCKKCNDEWINPKEGDYCPKCKKEINHCH